MARPSKISKALTDRICRRIAAGESLRSICAEKTMPTISTVLLWVVQDRDGFSEQYAQAREAAGYAHADRLIDVIDKVAIKELDPNRAKVMLDGLKWAAERMAPKKHSPRQELTGPEGSAVHQSHTITTTDPVEAAKQYQKIMGGNE